ncbi:MAG: twin-arginine translocase TatA/TatE family subunit [Lachnospiraceae bacterium]|nr:twin-arginine translocase TatA/TatE family subunit [Lachnospiraceae bacterium]
MKIGATELIVIIIVALLVIGPDKLPGYAKKLGKGLSSLKDTSSVLAKEIRENVTEPLQDIVEPLQEIAEPIREITKPLDDATKSLKEIGKPRPKAKVEEEAVDQVVADVAEPVGEALYDVIEDAAEAVDAEALVAPVAEEVAEAIVAEEPVVASVESVVEVVEAVAETVEAVAEETTNA